MRKNILENLRPKTRMLIDRFRTVAHSINEWRDTYYYTIAGVYVAQQFVQTGGNAAVKAAGLVIGAREMVRGMFWFAHDNAIVPEGRSRFHRDHKSLGLNALGVAIGSMAVLQLAYASFTGHSTAGDTPDLLWNIGSLAGSAFLIGITGTGINDLVTSYSEVMFDHPRKIANMPSRRNSPAKKAPALDNLDC